MSGMAATTGRAAEIRVLRGVLIGMLVLLGVQGWSGDFFTVFAAPSSAIARPALSPGGFLHELAILPTASIPLWHAFEGLALFALAAVIVALSWRASHSRGVRFWSILGLVSILSAGLGGLQFVG